MAAHLTHRHLETHKGSASRKYNTVSKRALLAKSNAQSGPNQSTEIIWGEQAGGPGFEVDLGVPLDENEGVVKAQNSRAVISAPRRCQS